MKLTLVVLLMLWLGGCAGQPENAYWIKFHGEDEFYKWVCQYDPSKKVKSYEGPTITYAEMFNAQCFRTLDLKPRTP